MGWTSTTRRKGYSNRQYFSEMLNHGDEILECATVRGTFYAAVREQGGEVSALVALTRWAPRADYNFSYKTMSEDMGPNEADAPARVLDLLSPTTSAYAQQWRDRCRKNLEARAAVPRVRVGDVVEFKRPLSFTNGDELDTFVLVRRGVFKDPTTGRLYRIPNYRSRAFRLVGAE